MNERQKEFGELFAAHGGGATEEALDQIAIFVEMPFERTWTEPVGPWRNHGQTALRRNLCDDGIRVVPLVGYFVEEGHS